VGKCRKTFSRKERGRKITKLMARDGELCMLCGEVLDRHIKDDKDVRYITFDHKTPRSKLGDDDLPNLQLAHQGCNRERGSDPILPEDEE
jgi:5-methylcytosine-specific restriction endonuclease McrA